MRRAALAWIFLPLALTACERAQDSSAGDAGPADGGVFVDLDGGGPVATPPDGAKACPTGACNYQTNVGCSAGEACGPSLDGATVSPACSAAGAGHEGDSCADSTACAAGDACIAGACRRLCCGGDWSVCGTNDRCYTEVAFEVSGKEVAAGVEFCAPANDCDPLVPSSCTTQGTSCLIVDASFASACVPPGKGEFGDPCPCAGGFLCVDNACRRLCKAVEGGAAPYCQTGEGICVHFARDPEAVGECTVPEN